MAQQKMVISPQLTLIIQNAVWREFSTMDPITPSSSHAQQQQQTQIPQAVPQGVVPQQAQKVQNKQNIFTSNDIVGLIKSGDTEKLTIHFSSSNTNMAKLVNVLLPRCEINLPISSYSTLLNPSEESILHMLVRAQMKDIIKLALLNSDIQFDIKNSQGESPLFEAIRINNFDIFRLLLVKCNPFLLSNKGNSPFYLACNYGRLLMIQQLLRIKTLDINQKCFDDDTPLNIACWSKQSAVALFLLQQPNIDPSIGNTRNETPLHWACARSLISVIQSLISHKSLGDSWKSETIKDKDTPLHWAARNISTSECLVILCKELYSVDFCSSVGNTALHAAVSANNIKNVQKLLELNANPNILNSLKISPLYDAVFRKHADLVSILARHPSTDVNLQNYAGDTSFILSVFNEETKISKMFCQLYLVEKKIDLSVQNNVGDTVLHWIARKGFINLINDLFLLAHRINPNIVNKKGETPLHVAIRNGNVQVALTLLKFPTIDISITCEKGNSVLHDALLTGQTDVARVILFHSDFKSRLLHQMNHKGETALICASFKNSPILLLLIMWAPPSLEYLDKMKDSANRGNHPKLVSFLESLRPVIVVRINQYTKLFSLMLREATFNGDFRRVKTLLTCRNPPKNSFILPIDISLTERNSLGKNVLEIAAENGHISIFDLLAPHFEEHEINSCRKYALLSDSFPLFQRCGGTCEEFINAKIDYHSKKMSEFIFIRDSKSLGKKSVPGDNDAFLQRKYISRMYKSLAHQIFQKYPESQSFRLCQLAFNLHLKDTTRKAFFDTFTQNEMYSVFNVETIEPPKLVSSIKQLDDLQHKIYLLGSTISKNVPQDHLVHLINGKLNPDVGIDSNPVQDIITPPSSKSPSHSTQKTRTDGIDNTSSTNPEFQKMITKLQKSVQTRDSLRNKVIPTLRSAREFWDSNGTQFLSSVSSFEKSFSEYLDLINESSKNRDILLPQEQQLDKLFSSESNPEPLQQPLSEFFEMLKTRLLSVNSAQIDIDTLIAAQTEATFSLLNKLWLFNEWKQSNQNIGTTLVNFMKTCWKTTKSIRRQYSYSHTLSKKIQNAFDKYYEKWADNLQIDKLVTSHTELQSRLLKLQEDQLELEYKIKLAKLRHQPTTAFKTSLEDNIQLVKHVESLISTTKSKFMNLCFENNRRELALFIQPQKIHDNLFFQEISKFVDYHVNPLFQTTLMADKELLEYTLSQTEFDKFSINTRFPQGYLCINEQYVLEDSIVQLNSSQILNMYPENHTYTGSYSTVFGAMNIKSTPTEYAIVKMYFLDRFQIQRERFSRNSYMLSHLDHPFVFKPLAITQSTDDSLGMILFPIGKVCLTTLLLSDFAAGAPGEDNDSRFDLPLSTPSLKKQFFFNLLLFCSFLHNQNIVHGQINPDTIGVDAKNRFLICGFDNCWSSELSQKEFAFSDICVSDMLRYDNFYPPEHFSPDDPVLIPTTATDIYSIGLIMSLVYFPQANIIPVQTNKHLYQFGTGDKNLVDLLSKCLLWDPKQRISAHEALAHPFFQTNWSYPLDRFTSHSLDGPPKKLMQLFSGGLFKNISNQEETSRSLSVIDSQLRWEIFLQIFSQMVKSFSSMVDSNRDSIRFTLSRDDLVPDILNHCSRLNPTIRIENLLFRVVISFKNEAGIDVGGLYRAALTQFFGQSPHQLKSIQRKPATEESFYIPLDENVEEEEEEEEEESGIESVPTEENEIPQESSIHTSPSASISASISTSINATISTTTSTTTSTIQHDPVPENVENKESSSQISNSDHEKSIFPTSPGIFDPLYGFFERGSVTPGDFLPHPYPPRLAKEILIMLDDPVVPTEDLESVHSNIQATSSASFNDFESDISTQVSNEIPISNHLESNPSSTIIPPLIAPKITPLDSTTPTPALPRYNSSKILSGLLTYFKEFSTIMYLLLKGILDGWTLLSFPVPKYFWTIIWYGPDHPIFSPQSWTLEHLEAFRGPQDFLRRLSFHPINTSEKSFDFLHFPSVDQDPLYNLCLPHLQKLVTKQQFHPALLDIFNEPKWFVSLKALSNSPVTSKNVNFYIKSQIYWDIIGSRRLIWQVLHAALYSVFSKFPSTVLGLMRPHDLPLLLGITGVINPLQLIQVMEFHSSGFLPGPDELYTPKLLEKWILEADPSTLKRLIYFITGSTSLPVSTTLKESEFQIDVMFLPGAPNAYPVAETCYWKLCLPDYRDYDLLDQKFSEALLTRDFGMP